MLWWIMQLLMEYKLSEVRKLWSSFTDLLKLYLLSTYFIPYFISFFNNAAKIIYLAILEEGIGSPWLQLRGN